jgi:alcohol dehydrogenase YqhD (iron-dependent ADH family)
MGVNSGVGDVVAGDGVKNVLLLYGGESVRTSGALGAIAESLAASGVAFTECGGVKANPVVSKVREVARAVRESGAGAIVAAGGGSVIDSAKGVAAAAVYDGDPWDFYSRKAVVERALPVYAVVTVSATASEVNCTSVLTDAESGTKAGLTAPALFPRAAFIDPSVQFSVSARQSARGGADAICHVMETYFDGTPDVEVMMEYAEGLIRSLIALTPDVIARPRDYEARAQFAWAAACALNGTTWAGHAARGDFASHAMGHALSARYDAAHGETLAAVMPSWMRYVRGDNLPAFARFARRVFGVGAARDEDAADEGTGKIRDFFASLGLPVSLRGLGVPEEDLPALAKKAAGASPIGALRKLGEADVLSIYRYAY